MTTIVTINNINKSFGSGQAKTVALNNINFSITEKEFISISGPSGCGKSTLFNILGLLDTSSEGTYFEVLNGKIYSRTDFFKLC